MMGFVDEEASDNYAALYKNIVRGAFSMKDHLLCKGGADKCQMCEGLRGIKASVITRNGWQPLFGVTTWRYVSHPIIRY